MVDAFKSIAVPFILTGYILLLTSGFSKAEKSVDVGGDVLEFITFAPNNYFSAPTNATLDNCSSHNWVKSDNLYGKACAIRLGEQLTGKLCQDFPSQFIYDDHFPNILLILKCKSA